MDPIQTQGWRELLHQTYEQTIQQLIAFTPNILGALALFFFGFFIALALARAVRTGVTLLEKLLGRLFARFSTSPSSLKLRQSYTNVISKAVFWLVLLFFIAAGANSLGLNIVSQWMSQLLLYLPHFAAGMLIMLGGYLLSKVINLVMTSAAESVGIRQSALIGRSVQFTVIFIAVVIGIEQIGINIQFFTQFTIILSAVIAGGFSLAFALGAKYLVANIIGSQQVNKLVQLGDEVSIAGVDGVVVDITSSVIVLETPQGRTAIPGSFFMEHISQIRAGAANHAKEK
ncbi:MULTISPECIES: mechanosensitive ion channel family protein [unclassified Hahella]|uniref:mechanosensitive ion channel family protein n=1 Tax=unclassified Hahella TaxID=2624107 RepID=UPI001C1E9AC0|nr:MULTISPECIES: mechanosensitive ion channel domain-containing protein [unclassified Hahella]MBU6951193.1 mechanosensitive ion channel [Hahella sp. HN01]MDG9670457.1 mechanosensitive ion channel [Hahella sp. CR1]